MKKNLSLSLPCHPEGPAIMKKNVEHEMEIKDALRVAYGS